jgi:hypothetical protein
MAKAAKPKPAAKRSTPAAKRSAPAAKRSAPAAKRSAPAAKRSAPAAKAAKAARAAPAAKAKPAARNAPAAALRAPAGPDFVLDLADGSLPGLPALALSAARSFAAGAVLCEVPVHLVNAPPFISVRVVDESAVFSPVPYAEYGTADVSEAAIAALCGPRGPRRVLACPRLTTTSLILFGGGVNQKVLRGVPNAKAVLAHWKGNMCGGAVGMSVSLG